MVSDKDPPTEAVPVLVVDDDVAILELCARLLTSRGYAVDMAMNAEEALRRAEENPYRVILLDLKLPGMDGMACMRRLKEQGCRAEIVMVTGYGTIPAAVEAMTFGALDFLEKPFNPDLLVAKVQEIIARQDRSAKLSDDPLVAFIQEHATEVNSRRDVATQLGVSLEQVSHRVQTATGQSFRQFLHNLPSRPLQALAGVLGNEHFPDRQARWLSDGATLQQSFPALCRRVAETIPSSESSQYQRPLLSRVGGSHTFSRVQSPSIQRHMPSARFASRNSAGNRCSRTLS